MRSVKSGAIPTEGMTLITSGLCVRNTVFTDAGLRFNEALWLYAIDTDFFCAFVTATAASG